MSKDILFTTIILCTCVLTSCSFAKKTNTNTITSLYDSTVQLTRAEIRNGSTGQELIINSSDSLTTIADFLSDYQISETESKDYTGYQYVFRLYTANNKLYRTLIFHGDLCDMNSFTYRIQKSPAQSLDSLFEELEKELTP